MIAIYLAQLAGYDGQRVAVEVMAGIEVAATYPENRIQFRAGARGQYFFQKGAVDVDVKYEDCHAKVELAGREDRVNQVKSELLRIMSSQGLTLT